MTLTDFFPFLEGFSVDLIVKIPVLILIFIYSIFAIILLNKTLSLGRLVFIESSPATFILSSLATLHLFLTVLLFILSLAIL